MLIIIALNVFSVNSSVNAVSGTFSANLQLAALGESIIRWLRIEHVREYV